MFDREKKDTLYFDRLESIRALLYRKDTRNEEKPIPPSGHSHIDDSTRPTSSPMSYIKERGGLGYHSQLIHYS